MTSDEAAWVRDRVLPATIRREALSVCPCSYGRSGHCMADRHRDCPGHTIASPETWITDHQGVIVGPRVWLADRVCAWTCPCDCHTSVVPSIQLVGGVQPALF